MRVIITQPMLFAWPGFFEHISLCDKLYILDDVQFSKGSRTNRVQYTQTPTEKWLTIPVASSGHPLIKDLIIVDKSKDWKKSHISLLQNVMGKKPYFQDVQDILVKTYSKETFIDIVIESMLTLIDYFSIDIEIYRTSSLNINKNSTQRVLDILKTAKASEYITGHGAFQYLDHSLIESNNISVHYIKYGLQTWPFTDSPYVTSLDLISSLGKKSKDIFNPSLIHWSHFRK